MNVFPSFSPKKVIINVLLRLFEHYFQNINKYDMADGYYINRKYLSVRQEMALIYVINGAPPDVEILTSILETFAVPK